MKNAIFKTLVLIGSTPIVSADPGRTSASYHLVHETTTGAYGGRSTSANYTLDHSGNPATSVSSFKNIYTHRDGFIGQLADLSSLEILGPSSVNEDAASNYSAQASYDDGTLVINLAPFWFVRSGPTVSITQTGSVTTSPIYQNAPSVIGARFGNIVANRAITLHNTRPDNFQTYAADGIFDLWQVQNFGIDNPEAAPTKDPDGDGSNNLTEYLTGHDPNDLADFLVTTITDFGKLTLSKVIPDRVYTLFRSTDLKTWKNSGVSLKPSSENTDQEFVDPDPAASGSKPTIFHRVGISD